MRAITIALFVFVCGAAVAAPVRFTIDSRTAEHPPLRLVAERLDAGADPVIAIAVASATEMDLGAGHWVVRVDDDEVWSDEYFLSVGSESVNVAVLVLPAGFVTGRLVLRDRKEAMPSEVFLRLEGHSREVRCPATDATFRCKVPAGSLCLRVRAPGFVPRTFEDVNVQPARTRMLGAVVLERGASLAGTVTPAAGMSGVRVTAASAAGRYAVAPGRRGHFVLSGLPPGQYDIVATADGGLSSDTVEVAILADTLAELREPLRIEAPRRLQVTITPPRDPAGEDWSIALARSSTAEDELMAKESADGEGQWTSPPLRTGHYVIEVGPARGGMWAREQVAIEGGDAERALDLTPVRVAGVVTFRDRPMPSRVRFVCPERALVELETGIEGRFEGTLPPSCLAWSAIVSSDHPRVRRTFTGVHPTTTLELRVPVTSLTGTVLDSLGNPREATINITSSSEGLLQTATDADGWFGTFGLAAGTYEVQASAFLAESDVQRIVITDDASSDPLQLVLRDVSRITGRVLAGAMPAAGATVWLRATDVPHPVVMPISVDENGSFGLTSPPASREVDIAVAAPGFDFRMFHTLVPEVPIVVPVRQEGGTITVPRHPDHLRPYLLHAGAVESVDLLKSLWYAQSRPDGSLAIPSMEPGAYTICFVSETEQGLLRSGAVDRARCADGFLPPRGTLEFADPPVLARRIAR